MRYVGVDDLPYRPDVIVSDVSFISLTYLMAAIAEVAAPAAQIVLLVKPQFEVGQKGRLGKNGIVTDPSLRAGTRTGGTLCARTRSAGCGERSLSDRRHPWQCRISSLSAYVAIVVILYAALWNIKRGERRRCGIPARSWGDTS